MITSSPGTLWAVVADGAAWPSWGSGVEGVDGRIAPGGRCPDLGPSFEPFAQGVKRPVAADA